jgi:transcriptional regulator with XRE-family HTH domain
MPDSTSSGLTTAQLIKHYRKLRGWNQSELAARVGIRPQSVQSWEAHDTTPRARLIPKIAEVLGVQPRDLADNAPLLPEIETSARLVGGSEQGSPSATLQAVPVAQTGAGVWIKRLQAATSVGDGVELIVVSPAWAARTFPDCNPAALRVVDARGDSMEPTLTSGDWLVIDTDSHTVDVDAIWALRHRVKDELFIKRLQRRLDGSWLMISDNPAYQPESVPPEVQRHLEVVGRVVGRNVFTTM